MNINQKISVVLLAIITSILSFGGIASADIGPKPTMSFNFEASQQLMNDKSIKVIQYECNKADCSDEHVLENVGPQGMRCDSLDDCGSMAYGYADYHRLHVIIGSTELASNIFKTKDFRSTYTVKLSTEGVGVDADINSSPTSEPHNININTLIINTGLTIFIELFILSVLVLLKQLPRFILLLGLIVNIITVPLLYFTITLFNLSDLKYVIPLELVVVVVEALFYYYLMRKRQLVYYNMLLLMLLLSLLLNLVSYLAGLLITF